MIRTLPESLLRGCWLEIDLSAIRDNVVSAKTAAPEQKIMAIVKANAYGHGDVPVAFQALDAGADMLGVSGVDEGENLRRAGIDAPILVLGGMPFGLEDDVVRLSLTQAVYTPEHIRLLEAAAERLGADAYVHLKLDTGMGRIGVRGREELQSVMREIEKSPRVKLTGAFTHFADSDNPKDDSYTKMQLSRLKDMLSFLPDGITVHAANSAAIYRYNEAHMDMVRLGITMYGYDPTGVGLIDVRPAMEWKALITHIKEIDAGEAVSYGCIFRAGRKTRVATVCCGYADGYHRLATGKGSVLVCGKRAPIIGRICMDQMMIDVTDIPECACNQAVTLLGRDGNEAITADDIAGWAETISYEIICAPSLRVKRLYRIGGRLVENPFKCQG
ncbi:MAG: alanine racemase [Eubacteriales bacterium]|nr:alanine racemase [Eubacteriales bacterium]MDD3881370.1 alanine racemase [Eubacteriales bacterium]MDD4513057.1 alanine racemase [Eubacteriales bacterium]